jgi:ABC-type oligopeptide transport system ATPase subunit
MDPWVYSRGPFFWRINDKKILKNKNHENTKNLIQSIGYLYR